jgi:hypothetical protein
MSPKYVVTAGDHGSDGYAAVHFPYAELVSLRRGDNGMAAFQKFKELGSDAVMITSTTPLHFSKEADSVLNRFAIKKYYGHLEYILMSSDKNLSYGTSFEGKHLGGISPSIGELATRLVGAAGYFGFADPKISTQAALDGKIDIVTKTAKNGVLDTENGLHMVCNLTKEFGLKLMFYLVTHDSEHNADALSVFQQERQDIQRFLPL